MTRYRFSALCVALGLASYHAPISSFQLSPNKHQLAPPRMASTSLHSSKPNYNAVYVAKEGGVGVKSASEMMGVKGNTRSLGAPPASLPRGGTFITEGGITVDSTVRPLRYVHGDIDECNIDEECDDYVSPFFADGGVESGLSWGSDGAIERLIDLLDNRRGALLTSSYEFPGR
jgi:hypothetical protein